MSRTRSAWWNPVAMAAAGFAVASFVALHLLMAGTVDPLRQPVSSYALTAPGDLLFPLGALGLAAACVLLAGFGTGLPRGDRPVRALLAGSAVMLLLLVLFRTDRADTVTSLGGEIHRWSAGVAFGMLTAVGAGWSWWGRGTRRGRWAAVLTVIAAVVLVVIIVNTFAPELAGGQQWRGLPQRVLLAVQTLLVAVLASTERARAAVLRPVAVPSAVNTDHSRQWAFWSDVTDKPVGTDQLWLTGPGGARGGALRSGNGLRSRAVRRQ